MQHVGCELAIGVESHGIPLGWQALNVTSTKGRQKDSQAGRPSH